MSVSAPPRFGLRVPNTWVGFDVTSALRSGFLIRAVDERIREFPELRPQRRKLIAALETLVRHAQEQGAVYCAAAAEDLGEDGSLLASLAVISTEGMPEPALNTVEAIAAQLPVIPRPDDGHGEWREVSILQLEAGRAVRVRGLTTLTLEAGEESVQIVTMQTLLPIPGTDDILNVVLTSPHVNSIDPLLDLFDAISGTLTWEAGPSPR